jgi:hypothetical protein
LRSIIVVAVAVTLVLAEGPPAGAHAKVYEAQLFHTGTTSPPLTFKGFISSSVDRCFPSRLVRLHFGDSIVGSTRTNDAGSFEVESDTSDRGTYTIEVTRRILRRTSRHRHVCGAASTTADF